jgi:hypothetical protein
MTGVAVAHVESPIARIARIARALTRTANLATVGFGLVALHVLDDSFLQRPTGVEPSDHLVSGLVPLALLALAAWAYGRSRPGVRASLALGAGVFGLVASVEAIYATLEGTGASGDDFTGLAALPAGVLLLGVGFVTLWKSRRRGGSRVRRYGHRLAMLLVGLFMAISVVFPTGAGYLFTHLGRGVVTDVNLGAPAEAVTLRTSDGLTLVGSYVPSKNGAAIIVSPGYNSTPEHARMLVRHGYGVLLFDQRGEGRSDGDPNAFGWSAEKDHNAAIAFLQARPDVRSGRISEGAGNRSVREILDMPRNGPDFWLSMPLHVTMTAATAMFANETPPANLRHLVAQISPRPLFLISAGHGVDSEVLNKQFYAAAGEPRTLWEIPEAGHTGGIQSRPREYEQRVVAFFDQALSGR